VSGGRDAGPPFRNRETAMSERFGYCLNTATIRGQKLGIVEEVRVAAEAGYGAIEPWIDTIRQYQQAGGSVDDLRRRIEGVGLKVPGAIGFAHWIVDDPADRAAGLEEARRDMDLVRRLGGTGIAAPPAGADGPIDPFAAAERYHALLEVGEQIGVVPQAEFWGHAPTLNRLAEAVLVAVASGHRQACILADVFHMHKGGSRFEGLRLLGPETIAIFHVNDYPADPPREQVTDAQRVWPGDGVAPLGQVFGDLEATGFRGWLSVELFNPAYYAQPAADAARTGLEKTRQAVAEALGE